MGGLGGVYVGALGGALDGALEDRREALNERFTVWG